MHIQVMAPKVDTRLTNQPNTTTTGEYHDPAQRKTRLTLRTGGRDVQEDQCAEARAKYERRPWHTHAVDAREDLRGLSLNRKTIQGTSTDVQIGICCAEHEDQNGGVDDMVQDLDPR